MKDIEYRNIRWESINCFHMAESINKRTEELEECLNIVDNKKMEEYKELIKNARLLLKQAWEMGLREDN